jgi:hypothetical protein
MKYLVAPKKKLDPVNFLNSTSDGQSDGQLINHDNAKSNKHGVLARSKLEIELANLYM